MAIQEKASYTNNGWDDTEKIKGVTWQWPYYQSGAHDSQMLGHTKLGTDKNPNIGATTITVNGARTFITDIEVNIANAGEDINAFGKAKLTKLPKVCGEPEDTASDYSAFYKFEKPGYKPLYIGQVASWGASGSGSVEFRIAYDLNDSCPSDLRKNP